MTTTVPSKVPIGKARAFLADIATAANEHHAQTTLTRRGKPIAKVVHPDAGNMPHPDLWQAAQEAFDRLQAESVPGQPYPFPQNRRVLDALYALLAAHYGYDQETP